MTFLILPHCGRSNLNVSDVLARHERLPTGTLHKCYYFRKHLTRPVVLSNVKSKHLINYRSLKFRLDQLSCFLRFCPEQQQTTTVNCCPTPRNEPSCNHRTQILLQTRWAVSVEAGCRSRWTEHAWYHLVGRDIFCRIAWHTHHTHNTQLKAKNSKRLINNSPATMEQYRIFQQL